MARIPQIAGKADVPEAQQYVVDQVLEVFGRVRGPFSVLLHSPALAERLLPMVPFNREMTVVEAPLRLVGILATVREKDADLCLGGAGECRRRENGRERGDDRCAAGQRRPQQLAAPRNATSPAYARQLVRTNRGRSGGVRHVAEASWHQMAGRTDRHHEFLWRSVAAWSTRSRFRHPTTEIVSDMTTQGVYQNFAIDRVVYGKPAAETLVSEAARLGAKRVFLVVSRTLDHETTWVHEMRTVLGARYAGSFDGMPSHTPRQSVLEATAKARDAERGPDRYVRRRLGYRRGQDDPAGVKA